MPHFAALILLCASAMGQTPFSSGPGTVEDEAPIKPDQNRELAALDEAIRKSPEDYSLRRARVQQFISLNRFDEAIADIDVVLTKYPKHPSNYFMRAICRQLKKQWPEAIADITKAIELDPKSPVYRQIRGQCYYMSDRPEEAIEDFDEAIRLNPNDWESYKMRSDVWWKKNDLDKTALDLDRAIRLNPKATGAIYNRALLAYSRQQFDDAILFYTALLKLVPDNSQALTNRGNAWLEKDELTKAVADFDAALKLDPKDSFAYRGRGQAKQELGRHDEALADYDEAIRLDPKAALVYGNRWRIHLIKGDEDRCLEDLNAVIRLDATAADYSARAMILNSKKRYAEALSDNTAALRLDPNDVMALNGRAWIQATNADAKLRDGANAVRDATRACELTEWRASFTIDTLAAAEAESQHFDLALKWIDKAIETANPKELEDLQKHRNLFEAGKPVRVTE